MKFQKAFTSLGQWRFGQICAFPSCDPWDSKLPHGAHKGGRLPGQHLCRPRPGVLLLLHLSAASLTFKPLSHCLGFTICFKGPVLCISTEVLSFKHYHPADLSSITEIMLEILKTPSSILHTTAFHTEGVPSTS